MLYVITLYSFSFIARWTKQLGSFDVVPFKLYFCIWTCIGKHTSCTQNARSLFKFEFPTVDISLSTRSLIKIKFLYIYSPAGCKSMSSDISHCVLLVLLWNKFIAAFLLSCQREKWAAGGISFPGVRVPSEGLYQGKNPVKSSKSGKGIIECQSM